MEKLGGYYKVFNLEGGSVVGSVVGCGECGGEGVVVRVWWGVW